jgi:TolA-binding protein
LGAFGKGDYQAAVTALNTAISKASPGPGLESIYYTLGAAYFNLKDYPNAVATLEKFISLYPKSARLPEAIFSIGQASMLNNDYEKAAASFKQLERLPGYRDQVLFLEGSAYKEAGHFDEAIAAYEQLVANGIKSSNGANAAIQLVALYGKKKDFDKASAMVTLIRHSMDYVDNIMSLNNEAVTLGDELLEDGMAKEALECYALVKSRADVIKFQTDRLQAMQKRIDDNKAAVQSQPTKVVQLNAENDQLRAQIAEGTKMLAEFQKLPDFTPQLLFRIGRCYYQMQSRWESIVAYGELLNKFPDSEVAEQAMFAQIVASAEVNREAKTQDLCQAYLKKFPTGKNANAVGYLLGATALQANDNQGAVTWFGKMLSDQPASTFREEMLLQLGNSFFALGKYDDALKQYDLYKTDFPSGKHIEEVTYRTALCSLFAGKYENAMNGVNDYITKYPNGNFVMDAKYRLDVCKYAAQLYDEVIADCRAWESQYGKDPMLGEVLALLADAMAASGKEDDAVDVYARSAQLATTDEVVNYSLGSAEKILQKKGEWDKIGSIYQEFVKLHPDSPSVVTAVFWISKAQVHDGKVDEAKQFIADTIKKYIDDPKADKVEQLIMQLAQLCVRKKPAPAASAPPVASTGTTSGTSTAVAVATPVATPTPAAAATPPVDPGAELDALLGSSEKDKSGTARSRILFAKAQLALMRKQVPEEEKNFQAIADQFKPEDLSPMLLAQVGDYLLSKGQNDKAAAFFNQLMDAYPKSDVLDFAYNGLAEIAYQNKQYEQALQLFSDAIDKAGASTKLKDVTVGKAKTLLQLGKLDDAKKVFQQVASMREWRGESTAQSVYSLGEIAEKQNQIPEAIANYQRVYVAYGRFLPWVAKAYIRSAECFGKLGKSQEEMNTYRELLRNAKLANFPEADIARKRLQEAGQG